MLLIIRGWSLPIVLEQPGHKVNIKLECTLPVVGHGIHALAGIGLFCSASKQIKSGRASDFPEHCASVDDNLPGQ